MSQALASANLTSSIATIVTATTSSRPSNKPFQPTIQADDANPTGLIGSGYSFPPFAIAALVIGLILMGLGAVGLWWMHRKAVARRTLSRNGSVKSTLGTGGSLGAAGSLGRTSSLARSIPAGPDVMGMVEAAVANRYGPEVHKAMYLPPVGASSPMTIPQIPTPAADPEPLLQAETSKDDSADITHCSNVHELVYQYGR
ncbi:hypothetical protein HDU96_010541 [Phlyctochytrium bullatum]|nr:hypothetical protein HDU96_010541 [Phlyctochytrium bullatum]